MFYAQLLKDSELSDDSIIELSYINKDSPEKSIRVCVSPHFGSNMVLFKVGECELIRCQKSVLQKKGFTGNYVLFPFPNRIEAKKYEFDGQKYDLSFINRFDIQDLVHGFVFDQIWNYDDPVIEEEAVSLKTYIDITIQSDIFKMYPYECRLELEYKVTKYGVKVDYSVVNASNRKMPFGFGLHPYFSTLGNKDNVLVTLPAKYVMETNDRLIPSGKLIDVQNTRYDLRIPTELQKLNFDHVFTNLEKKKYAHIFYKAQNLKLNFETSNDFTHLVLYTGKVNDQFLCMENQTCSTDAVNLYNKGFKEESHLLILEPGGTHSGFIYYKIDLN